MRRFGEPKRSDTQYVNRPGAYAVLRQGDDLLLTLQDGLSLELQLPGGGIDPGEGVVAALHREVFEETGYRIRAPRRIGAYLRYTYMPEYNMWARKVCHIYLAAPARRVGEPPEVEHTALWMPMGDAIRWLTNSGDAEFVMQVARMNWSV